ncbi:TonB-dependent receptor plug domain-containing protein [Spirosoma sp.]|uniref:TonB-dependent receptor plug domain-containing protein n=1 Tax=Spirosoma sp. TaxID=1899569 RepID=UPI003B3B7320
MIRIFTLILTGLFPSLIQAQATIATDTTKNLAPVYVTASRLQQTATELGRNVTILPGRDISRFPVNSLDDLLRVLPSIDVQSRGSFGAQADITLRGSTFNQVLILIDGMRINDPLTGHFAGYFPITPAEIEQIEIVRGAGSAVYGPDAVGGVINIVTKTFAVRTQQASVTEGQATLQRGEWNLWNVNAGGFRQTQKLRVSGGVLVNTTSGQALAAPSTQRNDVDLKTYSLSGSYSFTPKISLAARAAFDRRDFNAQWFYTTSTADQARENTLRNLYQGQLRIRESARQQTEVQFTHIYSTDRYVFNPDPAFVPSNHQMQFTLAQINHFMQLNDHWKASVGGQYDNRQIESNDRGNHSTWHGGLYGILTAQTTFGLTATGSLRFDSDQSFGQEWVPQLNLSYSPLAKLVLRGSVGKSIRAADFTERYTSNNLPGPLSSGRNIGLPNLQAERALNAELGADWMPTSGVTVKATGFLRNGTNLIDYVSLSGEEVIRQTGLSNVATDRTYRLAQNLFRVETRGVEVELWVKQHLGAKIMLDFMGGYTHLNTASPVASQYLANFARHQLNSSLILTSGRFNISLTGQYKVRNQAAAEAINRRLTTDYKVIHAKAEYALIPRQLYVTAQIQNLFNEQYADLLGAQMPGRWAMGGLRWQLRSN